MAKVEMLVSLEPEQKEKIKAAAIASGRSMNEEIRRAIEAYTAGLDSGELEVLAQFVSRAEMDLAEIHAATRTHQKKMAALFSRIERRLAR
jgi:hypothetical protein